MVSGSPSTQKEGELNGSPSFFTYTERFYEQFPYYLSIGMTPEQYWEGDPMLAKYYREAETLRMERENQRLWLQGMYVYEAICDASPILHAFAKKGSKPHPYVSKPYSLSAEQHKREAVEKEKAVADKGRRMMEALMETTNRKFAKQLNPM